MAFAHRMRSQKSNCLMTKHCGRWSMKIVSAHFGNGLFCRINRPFAVQDFINALPKAVRRIAVLDRTKEPRAVGDPLHLDVVAGLAQGRMNGLAAHFEVDPLVLAGRYGLSSTEFDPAMAKAVFD